MDKRERIILLKQILDVCREDKEFLPDIIRLQEREHILLENDYEKRIATLSLGYGFLFSKAKKVAIRYRKTLINTFNALYVYFEKASFGKELKEVIDQTEKELKEEEKK